MPRVHSAAAFGEHESVCHCTWIFDGHSRRGSRNRSLGFPVYSSPSALPRSALGDVFHPRPCTAITWLQVRPTTESPAASYSGRTGRLERDFLASPAEKMARHPASIVLVGGTSCNLSS